MAPPSYKKRKRTRTRALEQLADDLAGLVRFRDPETGRTWNGFGRPPDWIRDKDRRKFRVN